MIFEVDQRETYTVMAAKGRLNVIAAPELKAAVDQAIAAGHRRLVLDLAETGFMDSSGLGALVTCLKSVRQAGGDLRIANAGEQILMVLGLTRLDQILPSYPSTEEAFRDG